MPRGARTDRVDEEFREILAEEIQRLKDPRVGFVTVTGVKDLGNNTIVANGVGNVKSFFVQNLVFRGNMKVGLCKGAFAPGDTFAVEGSLSPLSFSLCDNAIMYGRPAIPPAARSAYPNR